MKGRERLVAQTKAFIHAPLEHKPKIDRQRLGPFLTAYLACALWSSIVTDVFGDEINLDKFDIADIDEPTIQQAARDCLAFYMRHRDDLEYVFEHCEYDESNAGHDFWLSRNGHGAGFFDNGFDDVWDRLQNGASRGFGEVNLYITDNDEIRQYEEMTH